MKFNETWLLACALVASGSVGGCYVNTPKHEVADAEAIREAARAEAGAEPEDDAEAEDAGASDAGRDAGALADAGEPDADTCACAEESPETPVCLGDGGCVACAVSEDCSDGLVCDQASHSCVACLANDECTTAAAPVCNTEGSCEKCEKPADCAHLGGLGVCNDGTCVECTPEADDVCVSGAGEPTACNPKDFTCTDRVKRTTESCETCVSDDECIANNVCVEVEAGAGSAVCLPVLGGSSGPCPPPYVGDSVVPVTTANGASERVCTLRIAGVTCAAAKDYQTRRPCGQKSTESNADVPGSWQDDVCGVPGVSDGYCVYSAAQQKYLCSVQCTLQSGSPDCGGGGGTCGSRAHSGAGMLNLCSP